VTTSKRSGAVDLDAEPGTESGNVKGEKKKSRWMGDRSKDTEAPKGSENEMEFEKQKGSQRTSERERESLRPGTWDLEQGEGGKKAGNREGQTLSG
jgi:hypothetical protein